MRDRMPLAACHYRTFKEIERQGAAATASIVFHDSVSSETHLSPVIQLPTPHWEARRAAETEPRRVGIYK